MSGWRCGGVVGRQRLVDDLRLASRSARSPARPAADRELVRVAEVHRADEVVRAVHHADHAFDQVVAVAERAGLLPSPKIVMSSPRERLADEVRDDAAVERVHPRAVGVEDPHDADVDAGCMRW